MREIKFRVWMTKHKKMCPVAGLAFRNGVLELISTWDKNAPHNYSPEGLELMQFTGLKDKNGNEIYEGDICRYKTSYVDISSEVKWHPKTAGWSIDDRYLEDTEVIGNIWENPYEK